MPNLNNNGGGAFPTLNVGANLSPQAIPQIAPNNAGAFDEIAQAADKFGQNLQDLARRATVKAAKQQGLADAVAAGPTGQLAQQDDATVFGQTYNEVAKQTLGTQRQAALRESMGDAFVAHQDDPGALNQAFSDVQKGLGSSGFPDLDASLAGDFAVQRGDYMVRAASALRDRTLDQGKANFAETLNQGVATLAQTASGASFDAVGAQRVAGAYAGLVQNLAKYGPKEAFDVGGLHFDPDPSRLTALGSDDIAKVALAANKQGTMSWIEGQNDRLPTAAAKAQFLTDLKAKYAAQDPLLAGIGGPEAEQLFDKLETDTRKAGVLERQDLELHAKNARDQIDALKWGGAGYDPAKMMAEAQASGDPGLIAEAGFYASVDKNMRGVYRTVVGRQLGLIPEGAGAIPGEALDASGAPIAPLDAGLGGAPAAGSRAARNNNPGNVKSIPGGWPGQTGVDAGGFAQFSSQAAGVAAADKNLVAKQTQHGLTTIAQIIGDPQHGWAPAADHNDPVAYAARVAKAAGVDPNAPVDLVHNAQLRSRVLSAMFGVEGGGSPPGPQSTAAGGNPWASPPAGATPGSPAYVAWVNTREGFNSDPLKFAQGHGLAAVPPIIPQSGFSQDAAQASNFAAAMKQRLALGATLQKTYGVPLRLFTGAEQDDLKSYLQQDPTASIALAHNLTAAIGPDGATAALRELGANGGDALTELHLGNLAALGKTAIVNSAAAGMRLKAEGAEPPKWQTAGNPHVTDFDDVQKIWAPAFAYQPDVLQAVRNVADLARISDSKRGVAHTAAYYLQSAAGATTQNGATYGGVQLVNGAPALLPHWLRNDAAPAVLASIGRGWQAGVGNGPVYANGQRMNADDVARMQLIARPDGTYWLKNGQSGQLARRADGSVLDVHLDAAKSSFALSVPGSVLR